MEWKRRTATGAGAALLALLAWLMPSAFPVYAAAGTVYSCTINRCYAHPVTGLIEDSGGQASYATGQGMAEGAVSSVGIMEVTEDGAYYLTFRASLMDYTSNHSFSVQNVEDTGWSAVTPTVTANGSDSNGTTSDLCIQVPSENCVVRGSMYVTPMGRDVIFYFYPSNYTQGNTAGMTATVVTETTSGSAVTSQPAADGNVQASTNGQTGTNDRQADAGGQTDIDNEPENPSTKSRLDTDGKAPTGTDGNSGTASPNTDRSATNNINKPATSAAGSPDATLSSAQGLSLSTAADAEAAQNNSGSSGSSGNGSSGSNGNSSSGSSGNSSSGSSTPIISLIAAITASITISGLVLMTAAAAIICYMRKNWQKWGGYDDEEYGDEDKDADRDRDRDGDGNEGADT